MRLLLTNQGVTSTPQLPSLRAGLARAEGDIAALKAAGCELGINTGAGDPVSDAELAAYPTITERYESFFDTVLAGGGPQAFAAGSETLACNWFSVNVEQSAAVAAILNGPGTADAMPSDYVLLSRTAGASAPRPVRQAMQEYAARTSGVTYDEASATLLAGGANMTWQQFNAAMVAVQRDAYAYLKGGSSPRFAGKIVYDWKQGVAPLPFLGSGWWVNAARTATPAVYYYYPYRTATGTRTWQVSGASMAQASESTSAPIGGFDQAAHDAAVTEKVIKTAEHSVAIVQRGVESLTLHYFFGMPADDLATADSSVTGGVGYYPVGRGAGNEWQYVSGRDNAMQEVSAALRLSLLGSWKHLGARTGLMFPAAMDDVLSGNRHWGYGTPVADFKTMILDQITTPVSSAEASRFGLTAGTVMSPSTVSLWNATDYFLRGLFGSGGITQSDVWNGQHPTTGAYFARLTMERRAAGRTAVAVDWATPIATNQWYVALANILTDDILERVQATRAALDKAARRGAARATTLQSLVGN